MTLLANSEGTDQTVQMHKLIWAFTVCICLKTVCPMARRIYCILDRMMFCDVITQEFNILSSKKLLTPTQYRCREIFRSTKIMNHWCR